MLGAVEVTSLGYRSDLMIRALEGSAVTDHGDCIVVRSPANPTFWWGNFLLLAAPPGPGQSGRWLARFAAEFPDASHVALGIDVTDADKVQTAEFLEAGLRLDLSTVLTASAIHRPPHPGHGACYRPLAGDDDWAQSRELRLACTSAEERAEHLPFIERRAAEARRLAEAGHGAWFGAFRDGRLVAQLGLFSDGTGIARYQDVATHPAARRQGLAGTLVWHAGQHGLDELGASTLVIVADPGYPAIRIYRSVGFTDRETQIGLERPPAAAPSSAN